MFIVNGKFHCCKNDTFADVRFPSLLAKNIQEEYKLFYAVDQSGVTGSGQRDLSTCPPVALVGETGQSARVRTRKGSALQ